MKLIIDIPEDVYKKTIFYREFKDLNDCVTTIKALENGIPLEQIRDEIERLHYHPKLDFIKNDEVVEMALNVINRYMKGE